MANLLARDSAPRRRTRSNTAIALIAAVLAAAPADAIEINFLLINQDENPAADPHGFLLFGIAQAAAAYWERLLPGGDTSAPASRHKFDILLSYNTDFDDATTLAHSKGGEIEVRPVPTGGSWYYDMSPQSSLDEYDFDTPVTDTSDLGRSFAGGLWLFRDLTPAEQDDWFISPVNITGTLEVGRMGRAAAGTTLLMQQDLLSTMIHEIGHELGISDDQDYLLANAHMGIGGTGAAAAVDYFGTGHLDPRSVLMCEGCAIAGSRRLPSATDVLALAWELGLTPDLVRKHFVQGFGRFDWHEPLSWVGGRVPNVNDAAYIQHGGIVNLTDHAAAQNLVLSGRPSGSSMNGSELWTGIYHITVANTATIDDGSLLWVLPGGSSLMTTLNVLDGELRADGNAAAVTNLVLAQAGRLSGDGFVWVDGLLDNQGAIWPQVGHKLTITGPGTLDVDGATFGAGTGIIDARHGSIFLDVLTTGSADVRIGGGQRVTTSRGITTRNLIMTGEANGEPAVLDATLVNERHEIRGDMTVQQVAVLLAPIVDFRQAAVDISNNTPATPDVLQIAGSNQARFLGTTVSGNGILQQATDFVFIKEGLLASDNLIDVTIFDWGNSTPGQNNQLVVEADANLVIDSLGTNTLGNPYRGGVSVRSGYLEVNFIDSWSLPTALGGPNPESAGTLSLAKTGLANPTIAGQRLVVASFVNVTGGAADMLAPFTTSGTADILVQAGADLRLHGDTVFGGGFFNGPGRITQRADIDVVDDVYIDTGSYDWGNGTNAAPRRTRIAPGVLFAVRAADTGTADNSYRGTFDLEGGHLHVELPDGWTLPGPEPVLPVGGERGVLNLTTAPRGFDQPIVSGTPLTVFGHINVTGAAAAEIHANVHLKPSAIVDIAGGATLGLFGLTTFDGGSYVGDGTLAQGGDWIVTGATSLDVMTVDWGNSLGLNVNQLTVGSGATLSVQAGGSGTPDNAYRGIVRVLGTLDIGMPGGWTLPAAASLVQPASVLQFAPGRAGALDVPRVQGSLLTIGGKVEVAAAAAHLDAPSVFLASAEVDFDPAATLHVNDQTVYDGPSFTGFGTLQHNGSTVFSSSTPLAPNRFVQSGQFTVNSPTNAARIAANLAIFAPGSATLLHTDLGLAGLTEWQAGAIITGDGSLRVETTGSLFGTGSIGVDLINEGLLGPGASPGLLQIDNDFVQAATGILHIELGGLVAGDDYDRLEIGGDAHLAGALIVSLAELYEPVAGDVYDLLIAESLFGGFTSTVLPLLPSQLYWDLRYLLDPVQADVLRLRVQAVPLPPALWLMCSALLLVLRSRRGEWTFGKRPRCM